MVLSRYIFSTSLLLVTFYGLITVKAKVRIEEDGRKTVEDACYEPCPIERVMRIIGGKWTASIIYHLRGEPIRFNDLSRMLAGASKKMIDQRLKLLEKHGIVIRNVISDRPIAVSYELTDYGKTTLAFLEQMKDWSEQHQV